MTTFIKYYSSSLVFFLCVLLLSSAVQKRRSSLHTCDSKRLRGWTRSDKRHGSNCFSMDFDCDVKRQFGKALLAKLYFV